MIANVLRVEKSPTQSFRRFLPGRRGRPKDAQREFSRMRVVELIEQPKRHLNVGALPIFRRNRVQAISQQQTLFHVSTPKRASVLEMVVQHVLSRIRQRRLARKRIHVDQEMLTITIRWQDDGDADPSNVSSLVRGAEMCIAETRAVNRALRKAYGIGLCSVEELGAPSSRYEPANGKNPNLITLCAVCHRTRHYLHT